MSLVNQSIRPARVAIIAFVLMLLFSSSLPARASGGADTMGDYGDAPDATNHSGLPLNAYPLAPSPKVLARYPTVVDSAAAGAQGPWHRNPTGRAWLGGSVSRETNADLLPDDDMIKNIDGGGHLANADLEENALGTNGINLPQCAETSFAYRVMGAAGVPESNNYVNVWIDYNRDGDWQDTHDCRDANNVLRTVNEWSVANQPITVVAGPNVFGSLPFYSGHAGSSGPLGHIWMRISLTEVPSAGSDGSGSLNGYGYGETEDYLLKRIPTPSASGAKQAAQSGGGSTTFAPDVSYYNTGY